jgi:oxygen-independent coproporphyrinogen-3 oxidase
MSRMSPRWNRALLARHDLCGPRYTSYPTAPHFQQRCLEPELGAALASVDSEHRPLSLYFHIPFCDTICFYCGCSKIVTANKRRARPYLALLEREIALRSAQLHSRRPVQQLHFGGGTPTFLDDDELRRLMQAIAAGFQLLEDDSGDYAIEIHPGRMAAERVDVLRALGFNRLSMGVQDFDARVQRAVNRFNSPQEVREICERARRAGFHSLNMDLIYGLPHQNRETLAHTLEQVIALRPDRLSVFNYAHMPEQFKSQRQIDATTLPGPAEKLAMLAWVIDHLQEAGYVHIGMDHFALPDDALARAQAEGKLHRNFQGYTTHGHCDLLGFGLTAISAFEGVYAQNHKEMNRYAQALEQGLGATCRGLALGLEDRLRRAVINQLICHFELSFPDFEERYGIRFDSHFAGALASLQPLVADDLLELSGDGLRVSGVGRLLIRRICMAFDAYLGAPSPARYSRII